MLAESQSITLSIGAQTANRYLTGTSLGQFIAGAGVAKIEVDHGTTKSRVRSVARVVENKIAPDPLTAVQGRVGQTIALTINRPMDGFSDADVLASVKGFIAWLTASTDANLKKIIAGEN